MRECNQFLCLSEMVSTKEHLTSNNYYHEGFPSTDFVINYLTGGEWTMCHGSKLTNSIGKKQLELLTHT